MGREVERKGTRIGARMQLCKTTRLSTQLCFRMVRPLSPHCVLISMYVPMQRGRTIPQKIQYTLNFDFWQPQGSVLFGLSWLEGTTWRMNFIQMEPEPGSM